MDDDVAAVLQGGRQHAVVCGNALAVLPGFGDGVVDLVLTDPPYAVSQPGVVHHKQPGRGHRNFDLFPGDGDWEATVAMVRAASKEFVRLLAPHGSAYLWVGHREFGPVVDVFEAAGFRTRFLVWAKAAPPPPPPGSGWPSGAELCVYAFRPGRVWNHGGKNPPPNNVLVADTFRYGQPGKNGHPTQKPLSVVLPLILASSRPGGLVLDAFAGSGTVGVACLRTGRRFVGIELDPAFAALARSQLEEASNQTGLFAQFKQPDLFAPAPEDVP